MSVAATEECSAATTVHVEPGCVPGALDVCGAAAARGRAGQIAAYAAAWLFGAAAMAYVQTASVWPAGNDSLYHVRMAAMLPDAGFVRAFPWLHWTIFRDSFVSHHHGFHVALAPFAWLGESLTGQAAPGGKLFVIVTMGATAALLLKLLRTLGARPALLWIGLLAVLPWQFWMRMAFVRAPSLALPLLLLAVCMALRRRYLGLGVTAFVLTQVYLGSVILPLLAIAVLAAGVVIERSARQGLQCGTAIAAGMGCGFVVHPYFPANVSFLYTQLFQTGLGAPIEAGSEWRPFDAWMLFKMSAPLIVVWGACLVARLRSARPLRTDELSLMLFQFALLVLTLKARRFIEYWPVFLLLSAASLARGADWTLRGAGGRTVARWALATAIVIIGFGTLTTARARSTAPSNTEAAVAAATWLSRNSPAGALVLTDDWDVFPACFYANQHNRYAVGLDPVFTQVNFPELWRRYRLITRGRIRETSADVQMAAQSNTVDYADIATHFAARYVLVMKDHPALYRALSRRPQRFRRIYPHLANDRQPAATLFEVLTAPSSIHDATSRVHVERRARINRTISQERQCQALAREGSDGAEACASRGPGPVERRFAPSRRFVPAISARIALVPGERALLRNGQHYAECRTGRAIVDQVDLAAQRLGHAPGPGQPHARAVGARGVEQIEDARGMFPRNPRPGVANVNVDATLDSTCIHVDRRARRRVLHRVRQQLDPQRRQLVGVRHDRQSGLAAIDRDRNAAPLHFRPQLGNGRPNHRANVDPRARSLAAPGEVQQARHARAQPAALAQNILRPPQRVLVEPTQVDDQLGRTMNARQRIADAVRHARAQLADGGQPLAALLRGALPLFPQRLIRPLQLARVPQHADQRGDQRRRQHRLPARLPPQQFVVRLQQSGLLGQHVLLHVGNQPQGAPLPLVESDQTRHARFGRLIQQRIGLAAQPRQLAPQLVGFIAAHDATLFQRDQIGPGAVQRAARIVRVSRLQRGDQRPGQLAHRAGQRSQIALPRIEHGHAPQQRTELRQRLMMQPQSRRDDGDVESRQHDEVVIPANAVHQCASNLRAERRAKSPRLGRQESSLWPEYC